MIITSWSDSVLNADYNVFTDVYAYNDQLVDQIISTKFFVEFYLQVLDNLTVLFQFFLTSFVSWFLLVLFFGFWWMLFFPLMRRMTRL